jgi:hypothetical protein
VYVPQLEDCRSYLMIGSRVDATPSITQYREAWAIRNGCGPVQCSASPPSVSMNSLLPSNYSSLIVPSVRLGIDAVTSHLHEDTTTLKQSICSASNNDAIVDGFTVKCLGHSWPSTLGLDGSVTDFNATTDILAFFETHTLM